MSRFFLVFFMQALIGRKVDQTQGFLENGTRVPLSVISVGGNVVAQVKTSDHEGYNSIQLGFGLQKKPNKPIAGHIKKAGLEENAPRFFREIRVDEGSDLVVGAAVSVGEIFEPGDVVDVIGTSKGKGFAGVVKRYRFHGGPKTHGQSDRHRARGSSGSGTTPGRVYRGTKMAGRMGDAKVTVKNLEVLDIDGDTLFVKGLIPGAKGSIVVVRKVGKNKKFMPLWSEDGGQKTETTEVQTPIVEETQKPETSVETASEESSNEIENTETPAENTGNEVKEEENAS